MKIAEARRRQQEALEAAKQKYLEEKKKVTNFLNIFQILNFNKRKKKNWHS